MNDLVHGEVDDRYGFVRQTSSQRAARTHYDQSLSLLPFGTVVDGKDPCDGGSGYFEHAKYVTAQRGEFEVGG